MVVLNRDRRFNIDMTYRENILTGIASKIEKKFGREKPRICECREYEANKDVINKEIAKKKHSSEQDWSDCAAILLVDVKTAKVPEYEPFSSDEESSKFNFKKGESNDHPRSAPSNVSNFHR